MPLAKPLVLVASTFLCDATPQHEVVIVTDGLRAYAGGKSPCGQGTRHGDGPLLFTCRQDSGEPCDGQVVVALSDPGAWDAADESSLALWELGEPVEHEDHTALPVARIGDPKVCACGKRRDPVTHGWYAVDEFEVLLAERRERRGRFGADRAEGEANARAMNALGW